MDDTVLVAIVAGVAGVLGAVVTAVLSHLSARHKIKELEVAYTQKLRETYLQNAREYTKAIYVPLTLALSRLSDEYAAFASDSASGPAQDKFKAAIETFVAGVQTLRDRGAEAFLTNELEEKLRSFLDFLRESLTATQPVVKALLHYRVGFAGFDAHTTRAFKFVGRAGALWKAPRMSLSFAGIGFAYEADTLVAGPIDSNEFGARFVGDCGDIRFLVKEVTLGGRPKDEPKKDARV
jgi:hypothetical protein